ncbi:peptigoglycan-binding protein LysM, partial [bacterium]|nr:peptigoglycan-binding protein LysM [bacterium]
MNRKLAAAIAIVSSMHAGALHALGLGEITLKSHLNEPLEAEVRLQNVGDLAPQQILVELASKADFDRAGVERDYFLTGLQFNVELDGRGGGVLKVRTPNVVREPFVNFILEARWPNGRLLREYTLLLDPPRYSALPAKKINTPSAGGTTPSGYTPGGGVYKKTGRAPSSTMPSGSGGSTASTASAPSASSTASTSYAASAGSVTVRRNDTLWEIAKAVKPGSMTVQHTVAALH